MLLTRRGFLGSAGVLLGSEGGASAPATGAPSGPLEIPQASPHRDFPQQDPDLVRQVVGAAHRDLARVRDLVTAHPALADAAWDWGFGDWETPLGAAAHTGRREIAEFLLDAGARPTLYSAAMLGQLELVQAFVRAQPGVQRARGPHGIPLLAHARAGGPKSTAVAEYLDTLGDAGRPYPTAPLAPADAVELPGAYNFGPASDDVLVVTADDKGELSVRRGEGAARRLFHVGSRRFHPAGAPAVRLRFDPAAGSAGALIVADGPSVVRASRAGGRGAGPA